MLRHRSGIVTGHSGIVPTDSGIVTSDSGQALKLGTIDRNGWARWTGMAGHDEPESVGTMDRNTQIPKGSSVFANSMFTTGSEPKFSIPGIFLIPRVDLFVKVRAVSDMDIAMKEVRASLEIASPAFARNTLLVSKMDQYFAEELGLARINQWAISLNVVLILASVLLLSGMFLTRHRAIQAELSLRRTLGTPGLYIAWYSMKKIVNAILIGSVTAIIVTFPVHYFVTNLTLSQSVLLTTYSVSVTLIYVALIFLVSYMYARSTRALTAHV